MIYIATFTYVQTVDDVIVEGSFQVVGEVPQQEGIVDRLSRPRVSALTEHALAKVKRMADSSNIDFTGSTDFYLDSIIEFPTPISPGKSFVINLATNCNEDTNFTEVPLDEDTDLALARKSTQIGNNKPVYTHERKTSVS